MSKPEALIAGYRCRMAGSVPGAAPIATRSSTCRFRCCARQRSNQRERRWALLRFGLRCTFFVRLCGSNGCPLSSGKLQRPSRGTRGRAAIFLITGSCSFSLIGVPRSTKSTNPSYLVSDRFAHSTEPVRSVLATKRRVAQQHARDSARRSSRHRARDQHGELALRRSPLLRQSRRRC